MVMLVAMGGNVNQKTRSGETLMFLSAWYGTADILRLVIDSGGSVNEPDDDGNTPLLSIISNYDDALARLRVLLSCPELHLNAKCGGKTVGEWAEDRSPSIAWIIAEEHHKRVRWSALRSVWIAATVLSYI
jgi:ankyrin repeat protein